MGHIFISYARQNKDEVDLVVNQLEFAGVNIWIDRSMTPGDIVPEKIAEAITIADNFFLFISPASIISRYVLGELNLALSKNISIIPIILLPTEIPPHIELQIGNIEYIDLSEGLIKGVNVLTKVAGLPTQPPNTKLLLQSLADRVSKNTIFITPDLIKPKDETSQNIVVGTTINLKQLRDGCFMIRPSTLAQAINSLDTHVNNNLSVENSKINTFWIDGRSGSGKSVFLLQVMQDLILRRGIKAFWLANDLELLIKLLEEWARLKIDLTEPIYIFIDDFNAPQNRELIDYRPISNLLNDIRNEGIQWPILVTCSPPDYREDFQINGNDVGFRIQTWSLPLLTNAEKSDLLAWFNNRTREIPKIGPAFEQTNGLVLSMMFELRYGDMKEFGKRFKDRLERAGLIEALSLPLALNRLYIWPPKKWIDEFNPKQKEALAILNSDHDFSVLTTEKQNDEYIRLTHPHLGDVIYKAIRPQTPGIVRANDLATAFEKALLSNHILASRILRVVVEKGERIKIDLDDETLLKEMGRIWRTNTEIIKKIPPSSLALFWTNWTIWASSDQKVIIELGEVSPIDEAIGAMGNEHYAWGILWRNLWEYEPGNKLLINSGCTWLDNNKPRYQDLQWFFVWEALLQYPHSLSENTSINFLFHIGAQWLIGREDKDQWPFVWRILLQHAYNLSGKGVVNSLIELGTRWLVRREDKGHRSFAWQAVHKNKSRSQKSFYEFILSEVNRQEIHQDNLNLNYNWQDIISDKEQIENETSPNNLLEAGHEWLLAQEEKDQWVSVWQTLLQHPNELPEGTSVNFLIQLGIQWLVGKEEREQWIFVWQTLLQHPTDLPEGTSVNSLIQLGTQWLVGKEEKEQWAFVWRTLLQHSNNLPEGTSVNSLIQLGAQWLIGKEEKDPWAFVWQGILKNSSGVEVNFFKNFVDNGLVWLKVNQHRNDWPFIWEDLLKIRSLSKTTRSEILNIGLEWLSGKESHQSWSFVFEKCLQNHVVTPGLLTRGIHWVYLNESRPETPGIAFEIANYYDKIDPSERHRIHKWIRNWVYQSHPKNRGWTYGWAAYWKIMPTIESVSLALKWIEVNPENTHGTTWIIKTLVETNRPDVIIRIAKWSKEHSSHPTSNLIIKLLENL